MVLWEVGAQDAEDEERGERGGEPGGVGEGRAVGGEDLVHFCWLRGVVVVVGGWVEFYMVCWACFCSAQSSQEVRPFVPGRVPGGLRGS